jgi:rubredoxin
MTADPPAQVSTELQGAGQDITLTQLPREIYMEIADHEKSTADSLNLTGAPEAPKISKSDFFAQLRMQESRRGVVGTVHAKGKSSGPGVTGGAPGTAPSQDWTCPKCGASNYKHFNECQKCHALKRLTTYR